MPSPTSPICCAETLLAGGNLFKQCLINFGGQLCRNTFMVVLYARMTENIRKISHLGKTLGKKANSGNILGKILGKM